METVDVNYLAVLIAGIASMVIGGLWYSPILFGKQWMALMGITPEKIAESKGKGMAKLYAMNFVAALLMACVLARFAGLLGVSNASSALQLGFWVWIGFIATVMIGSVLWESKPWKLYFINVSYQLVNLLVTVLIVGLWK